MSRLGSYPAPSPHDTASRLHSNPFGSGHEPPPQQLSAAGAPQMHPYTASSYHQQQHHYHLPERAEPPDTTPYPHAVFAQAAPARLHATPDGAHNSVPAVDQSGRLLPRPLTDFVQVRGIEQFGSFVPAAHSPHCKGCVACIDKPPAYDQAHRAGTDDPYRHHVHGSAMRGPYWVSSANAPATTAHHPTPPTSGQGYAEQPYPARLPSSGAPYAYPPPVHYPAPAFGAPQGHGTMHVHVMQAPTAHAAPKQPIPRQPAPIGSRRRHEPPSMPRDPEELERRKRNALASAEFRIRRREREKALRDRCTFLEKRVIELEALLADARAQRGEGSLPNASTPVSLGKSPRRLDE